MSDFKLDEQPFIELTVRARRMFDEKAGRGIEDFRIGGGEVSINDERVGEVSMCLARVILSDKRRPYTRGYSIGLQELWDAFQKALDADPEQKNIGKIKESSAPPAAEEKG